MHAHKVHVAVADDHELRLLLPSSFPAGDAEVIVLSVARAAPAQIGSVERLDQWIASLPEVPTLPLEAFDRGEIYR